MSKKSRRRNKKILGALAAIGTGLVLANRGKGMEDSNISVGGGRDAASMDTSLKMPKRKMGVIPTKKRSSVLANPKINKMDTSEVDIPDGYFTMPTKRQPTTYRMNDGLDSYNLAFKKGGRVGCGIAKKGYGKAMKKGKK